MNEKINSRISELEHEIRIYEINVQDFQQRAKDCTDLENKLEILEQYYNTLQKIISTYELIIELQTINLN